jgi:predicted MFS family arabinose efflux permease
MMALCRRPDPMAAQQSNSPGDDEQHRRGDRFTQLSWYMGSNSLWMAASSLQSLLVTWILVGILQESPERVGFSQMVIAIPGLAFMLWGGVIGDRMDGRVLLIRVQLLSALPPLALGLVIYLNLLGFWLLICCAVGLSIISAYSSPIMATILNRVAGRDLQFAISLSTGVGALASIAGVKLAGEIEYFGAETILLIQAGIFVVGALLTARLHPAPPISSSQSPGASTFAIIREGLRAAWNTRTTRDIIGLNCFSSFFNAGAWIVAIPFIVTRVYAGDAAFLAKMVMIFTFGSLLANFGLLKFMPLQRPGRLFLLMQLTRILVLAILWMHPGEYLLFGATCYWGFNMGISSTMSRLMVQEIAPASHRSRIMSIYTLGMMSAVPVGAITLGYIIGKWGPLNALIPGMIASLAIFFYGIRRTEIWGYESPVSH